MPELRAVITTKREDRESQSDSELTGSEIDNRSEDENCPKIYKVVGARCGRQSNHRL